VYIIKYLKKQKENFVFSIILFFCIVFVFNKTLLNIDTLFGFSGDIISISTLIKSIIDNGWFLTNNYLGYPGSFQFHDYYLSQPMDFFIIWVLSIFSDNYAFIYNIYYMLTFFFVGIASFHVCFRHFNFSFYSSTVVSVLFAFLPYHFFRYAHLLLCNYMFIPFGVAVLFYLITFDNNVQFNRKIIQNNQFRFLIIFSVLSPLGNFYYVAFISILMFCFSAIVMFRTKSYKAIIVSFFSTIIMSISFILSLLPNILYVLINGSNQDSFSKTRNIIDLDLYSLRISQLLLPVDLHQFDFIHKMKTKFNAGLLNVNENATVSMGIIATIGFIMLLFLLFKNNKNKIQDFISIGNIISVLLFTMGGILSIVFFMFYYVTDIIFLRAFNRGSIIIAYFSLLGFAIVLECFFENIVRRKIFKTIIMLVFIIIGLFDQTPRLHWYQVSEQIKNTETKEIFEFINRIENQYNVYTLINVFQYPIQDFPGNMKYRNGRLGEYDLFKPYLYSKKINWSFGAMRGRSSFMWQESLVNKTLSQQIENIIYAGFNGIYLDSNGYDDAGKNIVKNLKDILLYDPIYSSTKRMVYFNLDSYIKQKYDKESNLFIKENQRIRNISANGLYSVNQEILHEDNIYFWKGWVRKNNLKQIGNKDAVLKINIIDKIDFETCVICIEYKSVFDREFEIFINGRSISRTVFKAKQDNIKVAIDNNIFENGINYITFKNIKNKTESLLSISKFEIKQYTKGVINEN